jgi:hypothetical protein
VEQEYTEQQATEPEPQKEGKSMRRLIYVLLALSVVLVGLSFAQNSNEEDAQAPSQDTWTVDLTEAGFGVVMFEPPENPANWGGLFV